MANLSYAHAEALLDYSLRNGTIYAALFLTDPTADGTGTEASGGGYARQIITFGAATKVDNKMQVANSNEVDFGKMTEDLGTIAYVAIYSAVTAGTLLWFDDFATAKPVLTDDSMKLEIGSIICKLS